MTFAVHVKDTNLYVADDRFENMKYTSNLDNAKIFKYFEDAKNYIENNRTKHEFSIIRIIDI
ncbi:MAG: hypothetical protein IJF92_00305 [Bacilli bacterium]|nr:hypothetical protein [Bacilli bacterium]MBQ3307571.1 hypothetical protein [Bacilli bacterium]